jgi:uncharacterized membrane protein YhiD involved in acid resistance
MTLDAGTIAKGFTESQGYYLAALLVVAMALVFVLYREAMSARIADSQKREGELQARIEKLESKLDAVQAQRDSQYERIITTANGVVTAQAALQGLLDRRSKNTKPKEDAA